jgi:hypothetical protein
MVAGRPGRTGVPGRVRLSAWIFLVDGEDDRVRGWAHVEPDDVLRLLGKRRIVRALEGAHAMGLDAVGPPDPLDRAQREADPLRDGAPGPVRDLAGRLGAGDGKDLSDGLGRHGRLAGWTRLVPQQSFDAFFGEALLPAPYRGRLTPTRFAICSTGRRSSEHRMMRARWTCLCGRFWSATRAMRRSRSPALRRMLEVWAMRPDSHISAAL